MAEILLLLLFIILVCLIAKYFQEKKIIGGCGGGHNIYEKYCVDLLKKYVKQKSDNNEYIERCKTASDKYPCESDDAKPGNNGLNWLYKVDENCKKICLDLDGFNEDTKVAFEYQGPWHYHDYDKELEDSKMSGKDLKKIEKIHAKGVKYLQNDSIKKSLCMENGIDLIVVPCFNKLTELSRKEKSTPSEIKEIPEDEKKYYEKIIIEELYKCDKLDTAKLNTKLDDTVIEKLNVEREKYIKEKESAISNKDEKIKDENEFIKDCEKKKKADELENFRSKTEKKK